jgi:zinc protease
VAGDVTEAELRGIIEQYFGKWSGSGERVKPPQVEATPSREIVIIDKPGAPQTAIRVATIGAARSTPDYVPLEVMNVALGGSFSSRINMNLREKHGYTYGASSQFVFRRGRGPFAVASGIRTDVTAPAVSEIFKEIDGVRQSQITPDELTLAKGAFALSLPGRFETSRETVNAIQELFVYDLPNDYYRTLPAKIDAVTASDVQAMANKYLVPGNMVVIAAGDRQRIEPELKKLDLGSIEVRDYEGNPINATAASAPQPSQQ